MGKNWLKDFETKSTKHCKKVIDEANYNTFVKEIIFTGLNKLKSFEEFGLWDQYDFISRHEAVLGKKLWLYLASGHVNDHCHLIISEDVILKLFQSWKCKDNKNVIDNVWELLEPTLIDFLSQRALSLNYEKREHLVNILTHSPNQWEQTVARNLHESNKKKDNVLEFPSILLSVFKSRIAQLSGQGLLPAITHCKLSWESSPQELKTFNRYLNEHTDVDVKKKGKELVVCRVVAIKPGEKDEYESTAMFSMRGALISNTEFEYAPVAGPFGMFRYGSIGHRILLKFFGASVLIDKDWERFIEHLAKAHAWSLSAAKSKGWDIAKVIEEKIEIESAVSDCKIKKKSNRL